MVDKHLGSADLERRVKQTLEGYAREHIHTQPIGKRSINEADNQDVQALETFYADLRRCRDHCDRKGARRGELCALRWERLKAVAVLAEHRLRCTKAAKALGLTLTDKHFMFPD